MVSAASAARLPIYGGKARSRRNDRYVPAVTAILLAMVMIGTAIQRTTTPWKMSPRPASTAYTFIPISHHLYLYQPNNQDPVDVTNTYYQLGYVFDSNGNPMRVTIDSVGHILDFNSNIVGFVGS